MKPLTEVKFIVIHCADTKSNMNVTVDDLYKWHVTENGWSDIGYHYFIKFDGTIHSCRSVKLQGAHCKAVNSKSIAICIEGGYGGVDNFTAIQRHALMSLIIDIKGDYKNAAVVGHSHFDEKSCPSFDVVEWYDGMQTYLSRKG